MLYSLELSAVPACMPVLGLIIFDAFHDVNNNVNVVEAIMISMFCFISASLCDENEFSKA